MKRFLGCAFAMFLALVAIALVGGDSGAVAGHGCHGRHHHRHKCHGGLLARLHAKHAKCHGEEAPACDSCGEAAGECAGCAEGGCAGGACGGEAVISSGTPTPAAAPAAPASGT
ncbi:MAG: hypothetical protein EBZ74_05220 [Planctomycetia bacterium]|nr:hypothetical protein [Planctomycetia bacterium]